MSHELLESVLPDDAHNRTLLDNVHPTDWTNPEPDGRYNLVVVGAGTAGLVAAAGAAGLGAKVALVERHLMGGDCLNYGCVPSKGIIRAGRAAAAVRDAERFGVNVGHNWSVDFAAAMERMRKLRAGISYHDSAARFRDLGIDVFLGDGQFAGDDRLEVGGQTLRFGWFRPGYGGEPGEPSVLIATGTGVAPFLSALRSLPDLRPLVCLYGVRSRADAVQLDYLRGRCRVKLCVSREEVPPHHYGRVTDLLGQWEKGMGTFCRNGPPGASQKRCLSAFSPLTDYYLCGLDAMIDEVSQRLRQRGVHFTRIHREVFFNA